MRATIKNFRGITEAKLELSPQITLICANNHAGKTSIIQALRSLFLGCKIPIDGVSENAAGLLVKAGAEDAYAILETEQGKRRVSWPSCKVITMDGEPAPASEFAVGFADLLALEQKQRAKQIALLTKTEPTADDLTKELTRQKIEPSRINSEIATIFGVFDEKTGEMKLAGKGWDKAHENAKTLGVQLKQQWQQTSGNGTYGEKKGEQFVPSGWEQDLTAASAEQLEEEVSAAKALVEGAIAAEAVGAHRKAELEELAAEHDGLMGRLELARQKVQAVDGEIKEFEQTRPKVYGPSDTQSLLYCPHCGETAVLKAGELVKPEKGKATEAERKAASAALTKWTQELNALRQQRDDYFHEVSTLNNRATRAKDAIKQLENWTDEATGGNLEESREALRRAETRLKAFLKKSEADTIHNSILANQRVIDVLAPDGLRQQKLAQGLELINAELAELSSWANWKPVQLREDLTAELDGRRYALISESEQYRVNTILRVFCARAQESSIILLDSAEILDATAHGKQGLINLLIKVGIPAVIAMTTPAKLIPKIAQAGLGVVYWVENGIAQELGEAVPA